jgi:hypothetical protein
MSNIFADRVKETTATTGTGTITLAGAAAQFQGFAAAVGNGNTCDYCLLSGNGTDWEVGNGTVTVGSPNTLARTTIYASSNAGAAISLSGASTVFLTLSAHSIGTFGSGGSGTGLWAPLISAVPTLANTGLSVGGSGDGANTAVGITLSTGYLHKTSAAAPISYSGLLGAQTIVAFGGTILMGFGDGTHLVGAGLQMNGPISGWLPFVQYQSPYGTYVSNDYLGNGGAISPPAWFKAYNDGTNLHFYYSIDGVQWVLLYSEAITSHLSLASDFFIEGTGTLMALNQGTS